MRTSRKTISSGVLVSGDVNKFEVKQEDRRDPPVDRIVGVKGRGIEHSLDELRVHLNDKLLDTDSEELGLFQSAKQPVEFKLSLRVARFAVVENDRAESTRVALLVFAELKKNESDSIHARINR